MVKVKNIERLQENIIELGNFALEHGFLDLKSESPSPTVREFVDFFTSACSGSLTRRELTVLVKGIQAFVRLPVYTTEQAAAWLGVGIDSVRDAVWREKTLRSMKPGHDVLVTHGWLAEYRDNGREGKND